MDDTSHIAPDPPEPDDGVKEIHPFHTIQRGQETVVGPDAKVVFSDFRSKVILNTVPTVDDLDPKDSSVQVPASILESRRQIGETIDLTPVLEPVDKDNGNLKNPKSGKQTSSSNPKDG